MSALAPTRDRPVDLDAPETSAVALRLFFNIARDWELTEREQLAILGLTARSTLQSWKAGAVSRIGRDAMERISYVLGIYKALHILLPVRSQADGWIRRPNTHPLFGGQPAIARMTSGQVGDLYVVRQYLDAERG